MTKNQDYHSCDSSSGDPNLPKSVHTYSGPTLGPTTSSTASGLMVFPTKLYHKCFVPGHQRTTQFSIFINFIEVVYSSITLQLSDEIKVNLYRRINYLRHYIGTMLRLI